MKAGPESGVLGRAGRARRSDEVRSSDIVEKSAGIRIGRRAGLVGQDRGVLSSRWCIAPIFSTLILTEKEGPGISIFFGPGSV